MINSSTLDKILPKMPADKVRDLIEFFNLQTHITAIVDPLAHPERKVDINAVTKATWEACGRQVPFIEQGLLVKPAIITQLLAVNH